MDMNQIMQTISSEFWSQYENQKQSKFARDAGIDRKTVHRLLYSDKGIQTDTLQKLCDALGLELIVRKKVDE